MPDEIKYSRNGRSYRLWHTKHGFTYAANWVVFPTKYRWHTDALYKWICPIRDCRNIFASIKELEQHTMKLHGGLQLNDNLDGTTSVLGTWESDYLKVISQNRPAPGTPAPTQPCLPPRPSPAGQQELTPPSSPSQGGSATAAILGSPQSSDATNPPTTSAHLHDDRDVAVPIVETPITARLEAAKRGHQIRRGAMNTLEETADGGCDSRAGSRPNGNDDEVLVFDDDDDDDDDDECRSPGGEDAVFTPHPVTPAHLNNSDWPHSSGTAASAQTVLTPAESAYPSGRPRRRSSERLFLRRLSASGSLAGLDPDSPSARRSVRIRERTESCLSTPLSKRRAGDNSSAGTGAGSAHDGKGARPEDGMLSTSRKRRPSQTSDISGNGRENNDLTAEDLYPKNSAAKRRGLKRLQIHVPRHRADAIDSSSGGGGLYPGKRFADQAPYPSPPNSQQESVVSSLPPGMSCCTETAKYDSSSPAAGTNLYYPGRSSPGTQQMEDWEISPGKISATMIPSSSLSHGIAEKTVPSVPKPGVGGYLRSPDLAYSASYLAQPSPVPLSPGVGSHVITVNSGDQHRFPACSVGTTGNDGGSREQGKKERVCIVTSGKAIVRMNMAGMSLQRKDNGAATYGGRDSPAPQQEFVVGQNSLFRVLPGAECLVSNRWREQLVLHVVEIAC
ncbi:uncharacterized protein B0I36DRAFT_381923 [Microdochium trichocladiopsis]|uniref:C2H2-type domain-containing protein n=1 Tax=Microdochium trichocladiopsis TaxID=1682393 RepID=A0A9P8YBC8_9PEZI|nr:uncharacterized protein B0I36DRAFT_381923 [Microdochium trichocladiopsis]KAH7035152.1 hypothetical protein B0I36DRAFT_381923 [Microdochium trichocladiopsis]